MFLAVITRKSNGVRSLTQICDSFASLSLANRLNSATINPNYLLSSTSTMQVSVLETRQGMYKEFTVEKVDDSKLDENLKTYKTAEETDNSKDKYWAILAVLLFGSFAIPMIQYYWYVFIFFIDTFFHKFTSEYDFLGM